MHRPLLRAVILSIGSELTVGETRDTNASELARSLAGSGVIVGRITALPDRLEAVAQAFAEALEGADLVVSTGGLGPTPDDLTREAIARVVGETPVVDPRLEAWLRELWARRDMPFPELNLKQAWLIPSADPLPNPNGTAPGWFVTRPDGRTIVALPGPPREMRPMWHEHAMPRLTERGLGSEIAVRTYRLMGIGESQAAELLGETLLRRTNPEIATYARADAVDVRVSATAGGAGAGDGRSAAELVAEAGVLVEERLGAHVWATGNTTWPEAIGAELAARGWHLAIVEIGMAGRLTALLDDADWLTFAESIGSGAPAASAHGSTRSDLIAYARRAMELGGAEVGVAARVGARGDDTAVSIAVVTPGREHVERRMAFLGGGQGRTRAALLAASVLLTALRDPTTADTPPESGRAARRQRRAVSGGPSGSTHRDQR